MNQTLSKHFKSIIKLLNLALILLLFSQPTFGQCEMPNFTYGGNTFGTGPGLGSIEYNSGNTSVDGGIFTDHIFCSGSNISFDGFTSHDLWLEQDANFTLLAESGHTTLNIYTTDNNTVTLNSAGLIYIYVASGSTVIVNDQSANIHFFVECGGTVIFNDGWSIGSINAECPDDDIVDVMGDIPPWVIDTCPFVSFALDISTLPIVDIDLGMDQEVCPSDFPITLDAGIADSYLWSTSETTQTIEVSAADIYSVEVPSGCGTTSDEIVITLSSSSANPDLGADQEVCPSDFPITLDAGIADSYIWSTGEITQTIEVNAADTYSVSPLQLADQEMMKLLSLSDLQVLCLT